MTFEIINPLVNQRIHAFRACDEDYNLVHAIVLQTAQWLQSKGSSQWEGILNGEDKHNLAGAITHGDVIAFQESEKEELAGCVILQEPSDWDTMLWHLDEFNEGTALYLHRLVVNRHYAGEGLGRDILSWVENGIQLTGKDRIRLDCIASNETLNRFYVQCGYTYIGETNGFSIYEKVLFDKGKQ